MTRLVGLDDRDARGPAAAQARRSQRVAPALVLDRLKIRIDDGGDYHVVAFPGLEPDPRPLIQTGLLSGARAPLVPGGDRPGPAGAPAG